jgi:membrane-bound lytic murein transglycosylase A
MKKVFVLLLSMLLSACAQQPAKPHVAKAPAPAATAAAAGCDCPAAAELPPLQIPDVERYAPPPVALKPGEIPKGKEYQLMRPVGWEALEGFEQDNLQAAWGGLLASCGVLKKNELWRNVCETMLKLPTPTQEEARALLQEYFSPWQVTNPDGSDTGLITGYYEPLLKGSRNRTERYRYPLYQRPDDLVTVELNGLYPELANRKLRGKLDGNRLKPYYSRGEIDVTQSPLAGKELLWTDDIVDLFFLQIQGSGLVKLDTGEEIRVGYADQNGQPYQSIGKVLIDRGELTADKASMQGIKNWGRKNLDKLRDLLNSNPSYVFFRELPAGLPGPLGALGVPIIGERSIAVDPRYIPLGAPVFLSATYPNSNKPLRRLVMAQDTGGAIKGAVRADFFWGAGNGAGKQAGAMKQQGKLWVLMPKGFAVTP